MKHPGTWHLGIALLLACGDRPAREPAAAAGAGTAPPGDSLVLTSESGTEVWFTLARSATGPDGSSCMERGLEIRRGESRVKVPLLYTGSRPVLLNDSTMRATLWTHCRPGDTYLVNLRSGQPVRERRENSS